MDQNEVLKMARQARLMSEYDETSPWVEGHEITQYVEAFAKLVAEAAASKEREACAKVCDEQEFDYWRSSEDQEWTPQDCAKAIRARGTEA
jgi:hypothetical protein